MWVSESVTRVMQPDTVQMCGMWNEANEKKGSQRFFPPGILLSCCPGHVFCMTADIETSLKLHEPGGGAAVCDGAAPSSRTAEEKLAKQTGKTWFFSFLEVSRVSNPRGLKSKLK